MKITDDEILAYIWDETLGRVARNAVIHYMGHKLGTYDINELRDDDVELIALLHRSALYAGAMLSNGRFRLRLNKLINQGKLLPRLYKDNRAFIINADVKAVVISAITFWQNVGLPFGYTDQTKTCKKTIPAESVNIFEMSTACYQLLRHYYPTYQMRVLEKKLY
ncbi:hypothetical protein P375_00360 [Gallibacterium genomosp. 2]|uniref:Uncharacterized protein n=1 Tax=Gallibacterium genomosp. 2 TaxID=155517 RepID=A0A0A2XUB0_9PAST|nr:hypothetical protein [Gallibacterium genomosp. 2]KGQ34632.1 hypothetical protein P375_00360 [Gallibacterium genomosp. 2]